MFKRFVVSGTKNNDDLLGTSGLDVILGKKGDDTLDGGGGDDLLFGGRGDDLLDGGAGSDRIFAGKGDDTANFSLTANVGSHDFYDGGKGFDTLQLTLTSAQAEAAEAEIEAFKEFLADGGKVFHFESLGLTVRNFEDLKVVTVGGNTPPEAMDDTYTLNEDIPLIVAAPGVLGNDDDAEDKPALTVAVGVEPAHGVLNLSPDGSFTYAPDLNYNGPDSFTYVVSDGAGGSDSATVDLTINAVNDPPEAVGDEITASAVSNLIRVAVIGAAGGTYLDATGQLNVTGIFDAHGILFTNAPDRGWTAELDGFDVVVLGEGGSGFDYTGETGLFAALRSFVDGGGGVVTTGWFAKALENLDTFTGEQIALDADYITPIAPDGYNYSSNRAPNDDTITITTLGLAHPITTGIEPFQSGGRWGWVLADALDTSATLLAEGIAGDPDQSSGPGQENELGQPLPAIAVDQVGTAGGKTVYLGGMYLAEAVYVTSATRAEDGVQDTLFERAVAWAAGGQTASVTINAAQLLVNDRDVESALLTIASVSPMSTGGRDIDFDPDTGEIVYKLSAQDVEQLELGSITDSFDYTVIDGDGATSLAAASVILAVTGLADTLL